MKNKDIAIIAAVGVVAYLLLKKQAPARGYSIDVPEPGRIRATISKPAKIGRD